MKLNCDLGESYGNWTMGQDALVMPLIDQANIACGFHAGDPSTIGQTVRLAVENQVELGAHPSYPDLMGFGRRSMNCSTTEIVDIVQYQIAALDGLCRTHGSQLSYVKPHGALYNDMMRDENILRAVMQAVSDYAQPLKLMILSTARARQHRELAASLGLELLLEGFADRQYTDQGELQSRAVQGAVHNEENTLAQVKQILDSGSVSSSSGASLSLDIDSLCVHGDNPAALATLQGIRQMIP